jgi:hypothetical protein
MTDSVCNFAWYLLPIVGQKGVAPLLRPPRHIEVIEAGISGWEWHNIRSGRDTTLPTYDLRPGYFISTVV